MLGQSKDAQVSCCEARGLKAGSLPDFGSETSSAVIEETGAVTITRAAISVSALVWMAESLAWLAG